jgi:hypothetical protein
MVFLVRKTIPRGVVPAHEACIAVQSTRRARLSGSISWHEVDPSSRGLDLRMRKTPEELALTRRACAYFDRMHAFARDLLLTKGTDLTDYEIGAATGRGRSPAIRTPISSSTTRSLRAAELSMTAQLWASTFIKR